MSDAVPSVITSEHTLARQAGMRSKTQAQCVAETSDPASNPSSAANAYGDYIQRFEKWVFLDNEASERRLEMAKGSQALKSLKTRVEEAHAFSREAFMKLMRFEPKSLADLAALASVFVAQEGERILQWAGEDSHPYEDERLLSLLLRGIIHIQQNEEARG